MNSVISILEKELIELGKFITKLETKSKYKSEGRLRIDNKKSKCQYYYMDRKENSSAGHNGRYMKKEELSLAKAIAQRDYDAIALKKAKERKKCIDTFINKYAKTDLKELYNKTHPQRRALIETDIISDEEYVRRWLAVEYKGKSEVEDDIVTERGECVRSKSEKIIADKLNMLNIPYRYEYPLMLDNGKTVYPDFTILKMPERKEVYFEHFGMIDDEEYFEHMIYKLNSYENNGIYMGINLFITYETSKKPLNTKTLNYKLKELFS
jgi:hypothetical protein